MSERRTHTIEVEVKLIYRHRYHVVGASSEEEARKRAILAAKHQCPPRKEGEPLPHVYSIGNTLVGREGEPEIVSFEAEPYKPCTCIHCTGIHSFRGIYCGTDGLLRRG